MTDEVSYRIVGDEYRTGVVTPEWWDKAVASNATVFVPDATNSHRVKDAALREHARRAGMTLHTRKDAHDGTPGTVYWITRKPQPTQGETAE